jgi:DKNYY family
MRYCFGFWIRSSVITCILPMLAVLLSLSGCKKGMQALMDESRELTKVDKGFHVVNGQAVYLDWNTGEGKIERKLTDADPKSFRALKQPKSAGILYAVDDRHVYMAEYYTVLKIEAADPASFEVITDNGMYSKDLNKVFYDGVELRDADPKTFQFVRPNFGKDGNHAYVGNVQIPVADITSWRPLENGYADDPWYRSDRDNHPKPEDPFSAMGWSADKEHLYYGARLAMIEADPQSFTVLGKGYCKDNSHVFYETDVLPEADAKTFQVNEKAGGVQPDARDSNHQFRYGKVLR